MVTVNDLRTVLEWLRQEFDAVVARGDYSGAYRCGYFDALIQVGWRFGFAWKSTDSDPGSPDRLVWEPPPEHASELTEPLKQEFYYGSFPAYVPIKWPDDLTEGLEHELRQGVVANRYHAPACDEDRDDQRGHEDALYAIAERCGIAPEAIGVARRCR